MEIEALLCQHDYEDLPQFKIYNANGEYVVGYGHSPVAIIDRSRAPLRRCKKCGYIEGSTILPFPKL